MNVLTIQVSVPVWAVVLVAVVLCILIRGGMDSRRRLEVVSVKVGDEMDRLRGIFEAMLAYPLVEAEKNYLFKWRWLDFLKEESPEVLRHWAEMIRATPRPKRAIETDILEIVQKLGVS